MFNKTFLCCLALAFAPHAPATAATFKISFDDISNGGGYDWFGTFTAPSTGGLVTSFKAMIGADVFDTIIYTLSFGAAYAPYYDPATMTLVGAGGPITGFAPDPLGADQAGLLLEYYQGDRYWGVGTCNARGGCAADYVGGYSISAVPVPVTLPLLASGLGALGLVARRRRKAV